MSPTPEARKAREDARKKKRRMIALIVLTAALFLGSQVWTNVNTSITLDAVRQTQVDRLKLGDETHKAAVDAAQSSAQSAAILALLTDCLEPTGECAKRGAQNTQAILAQIKLYIRDTAACQSLVANPSDVTALETCVTRLESRKQEPDQ